MALKPTSGSTPASKVLDPHQLSDLEKVANDIADVSAVADATADGTVPKVAADLETIRKVAQDSEQNAVVAARALAIDVLSKNLDNIDTVAAEVAAVGNVSINMASLLLLHARMGDLLGIIPRLEDIDAVAANEENINAVRENIPEITTVAAHMADIHYLAANSNVLEAVYHNLASVILVGEDIQHVRYVAENMEAVIDAGNNADRIEANLAELRKINEDVVALEAATQVAKTAAETAQGHAETAQATAESARDQAQASEAAAKASESEAEAAEAVAIDRAAVATTQANNAQASATAASTSASQAAGSELAAGNSATASEASRQAAETAEQAAANSASQANTSKVAAQSAQSGAEFAQGASEAAQNAAESAQTDAASSRDSAASSAASALASKNAATTYKDKAKQWAEEAEDVPVETGQYSAKHHAIKAGDSATAAANSETTAGTSKDTAVASAAEALASKNAAAASETAAETAKQQAAGYATNAGISAGAADADRIAAETARSQAQSAKAAAETAQAEAETAQGFAETAQSGAETAEAGAINARVAAETAESGAVSAKNQATAAKTDAESAQTSAESARSDAIDARVAAESANTSAQSAKTAAQTAQSGAETAEGLAKQHRDEAEAYAATMTGAIVEMGGWDASAGTLPTVPTSGTGEAMSAFWKITKAGTLNSVAYGVGDSLCYSKSLDDWYKIDNTESVTSVNGQQGVVSLATDDINGLRDELTASKNAANITNWNSITSKIVTTESVIADKIGLTSNDGYGNANLTFNHDSGKPGVDGSSGRIDVTVDVPTPVMTFGLLNNAVADGTAQSTAPVLKLREAYTDFLNGDVRINGLFHLKADFVCNPLNGTSKTWNTVMNHNPNSGLMFSMKGDDVTDRMGFMTDYGDNDTYTEYMTLLAHNGYVGINQTAPTERLHVVGNAKVEGGVYATGGALRASNTEASEYTDLSYNGIWFNRASSYLSPKNNGTNSLYVGGYSKGQTDWKDIKVHGTGAFTYNDNDILHIGNLYTTGLAYNSTDLNDVQQGLYADLVVGSASVPEGANGYVLGFGNSATTKQGIEFWQADWRNADLWVRTNGYSGGEDPSTIGDWQKIVTSANIEDTDFAWTGSHIFNTNTGSNPVRIGRNSVTYQALEMWVDDSNAIFHHRQDETDADSTFVFQGSHSNDDSNAVYFLTVGRGAVNAHSALQERGNQVYHAANANLSTVSWNMQNGRVYGDLTVNGESTLSGNVTLGTAKSLYFDGGDTYYLREANGSYGSVSVFGEKNGWAGYSIADKATFIANDGYHGLFDNANSQWAIQAQTNNAVKLYFAGSQKLSTVASGVHVSGYLQATDVVYVGGNDRYRTRSKEQRTADWTNNPDWHWTQKMGYAADVQDYQAFSASGNRPSPAHFLFSNKVLAWGTHATNTDPNTDADAPWDNTLFLVNHTGEAYVGGNEIYHEGNLPTPADLGVVPSTTNASSKISDFDDVGSNHYLGTWNTATLNRPNEGASNEYGTLINIGYDSTWNTQIAHDFYANELLYRNSGSEGDRGWKKIYTEANSIAWDSTTRAQDAAFIAPVEDKWIQGVAGKGFIPNDTGTSYVGTSTYRFNYGYFNTIYTRTLSFTSNDSPLTFTGSDASDVFGIGRNAASDWYWVGSRASDKYLRFKDNGDGEYTGPFYATALYDNSQRVYSPNNKPSLSDLGAAADSHDHAYLPLSGGTLTGTLGLPAGAWGLRLGEGAHLGSNHTNRTVWYAATDSDQTKYGWLWRTTTEGVGSGDKMTLSINGELWTNQQGTLYGTSNKPSLSDLGAAAEGHTHDYLPLSGGTVTGDFTVSGDSSTITALCADSGQAVIRAIGTSQGTGIIYAGQSSDYGGGFGYDGDNTPDWAGDSDRVTFFRRAAGTDTVVFSYYYNNSTVDFTVTPTVGGSAVYHAGNKPSVSELGAAADDHGHSLVDIANHHASGRNIDTYHPDKFWSTHISSSTTEGTKVGNYYFYANLGGKASRGIQLAASYSGSNALYYRSGTDNSGAENGAHVWKNWRRIFEDGYHPNADKLTTARTITLSGDASGSVSFDGSSNVSLTVTVANDSHTHDGRYYTESEIDTKLAGKADTHSHPYRSNTWVPSWADIGGDPATGFTMDTGDDSQLVVNGYGWSLFAGDDAVQATYAGLRVAASNGNQTFVYGSYVDSPELREGGTALADKYEAKGAGGSTWYLKDMDDGLEAVGPGENMKVATAWGINAMAYENSGDATVLIYGQNASATEDGIMKAPTASKLSNGWWKCNETGVMIQWGVVTGNGATTVVTFPTAFPTYCRSVQITGEYTVGHSSNYDLIDNNTISSTGFAIADTISSTYQVYWMAIGY